MLTILKRVARKTLPQPVIDWLRQLRGAELDEVTMVAALARGTIGTMVDVGAHYGESTRAFLNLGWSVIAYEPDPKNRKEFLVRIGRHPRLQLSDNAVSNEEATGLQLFASDVSTGISGLSAFHPSHEPTATVDAITLDKDLKRRGVPQVDFLKIDVEGFDFFALQGFDWSQKPRFVLYEFENKKTEPLGYVLADSAAFMKAKGYHLVYSVWEPIVEYGRKHTWRGLFREQPMDAAMCWGNVIAFTDLADLEACLQRFQPKG